MTDRQIQARLVYWKRKLGLHEWEFEVHMVDAPNGNEDSDACVHTHNHYDSAYIDLSNDCYDWPKDKVDRVLVHELLHVKDRNRDLAVRAIRDYLSPMQWNMYYDQVEHENEGRVEWTARLIVELDS